MKLPNLLTLLRILLIPVLVVLFYSSIPYVHLVCAAVFGLAGITDWLDGYLARKMNLQSAFGAFFDPVADKLIVAAALVLLVETHADVWMSIPAAIIIGREIAISALREWMAEIGQRTSVAVSYIGKLKTTLQMTAIIVLLLDVPGSWISDLGIVLLWGASVLTLWSMIIYLRAAWPQLTEDL